MGAARKKDDNNKAYFVKIRSLSEKKRIFEDLVASSNPLIIKASDELSIHAVAKKFEADEKIVCQYHMLSPTAEEHPLLAHQSYVVNFSVNKEEYFYKSPITPLAHGFLIETQKELFHLQRRKAMRLALPLQMGALAKILSINKTPAFIEALIIDFSTGGLRLTLKASTSKIKMDDTISVSVTLGKRIPFSIDAMVRYSAVQGEFQTCGIEFINKTSLIENKLHTLQLDMQSEIFRRWTKLEED